MGSNEEPANSSQLFNDHANELLKIINGSANARNKKVEVMAEHVHEMQTIYATRLDGLIAKLLQVEKERDNLKNMATQVQPSVIADQLTFAQVASGSVAPKQNSKHSQKHILHIMPKEGDQNDSMSTSFNTTRQILTNTVPISQLGIGIQKIQQHKSTGLSVYCRNDQEVHKLKDALQNSDKLTAEIPVKRNPVITILQKGTVIKPTLTDDIIQQNPQLTDKDGIKIVYKSKPTRQNNTIIKLEVSPLNYRAIVFNDYRLYIGDECARARDEDPTLQCFECGRFGHKAANCRNKRADQERMCMNCGQRHNGACQASEPKCCNCSHHNELVISRKWNDKVDTKHSALDRANCTMYKRAKEFASQYINYEY